MNEKQESEYLYDKRFICDVCNREFTAKQVRTGKARFEGTDEILKPQYTGIDCTKYDVIMCPHCGYAAIPRKYGKLTTKQRAMLRESVAEKFQSTWEDGECYSYDVAIRRCKMALLNEMIIGTKVSESAYLCLRLAWLYEGRVTELISQKADDNITKQYLKSQIEYIQSAYNGFKEAVSTEYLPICGMNEITLCYLLASLAYKCKDYDNARKNISLIVVSKAASDTIKKKARILLEHVIEEEQNKTVD